MILIRKYGLSQVFPSFDPIKEMLMINNSLLLYIIVTLNKIQPAEEKKLE